MNSPCFMGCCGCDATTTKICMTVTDACTGAAISGASVTVKDSGGATVGTCTTNGSGVCCVGVTKKDTYSAVVSATGYTTKTVTTLTISTCGTTVSRGVPLVATGLTCCKGYPLPNPFTATDSLGTCSMSKVIIGTDTHFCGGYTASLSGTNGSCDGSGNCVPSTISTAVLYDLNCTTGELRVSVYTASCLLGPHGTFCWTFYPATVSSCTLTPASLPTPSCSSTLECVISLGAFQSHTTGTYSPLNLTVDYTSPGLICNGNPDCTLNFPTTGTVTFTP